MHNVCVGKFECILKQIRFTSLAKKSHHEATRGPPKGSYLNSLLLFTKVGYLKPIQTTEAFKSADFEPIWPELLSKHVAVLSRGRMLNICDAQCSLSICYRMLWAHERNCGRQMAERQPPFLYTQGVISHTGLKKYTNLMVN